MTDGDEFSTRVEAATGATVVAVEVLDGGAIGSVRRVELSDGRTLSAKTGPTRLTVEAGMLRYLAARTTLPVPGVEYADDDLLLLTYVPGDGEVTPAVERDLADRLAATHETTGDAHGFHYDTLSGRLRQPNPWTDSWVEFFREFRLRHAATRSRQAGSLPAADRERIDALCDDLDAVLTEPDAPALVHGDVWTGNLVVHDGGVAGVLDPALFYGHPEYDLAYARWTGTVGDPFLDRYRDRRGLDDGAGERFDAYAVLALVEHVFHFGEEYLRPLRRRLAELGY